MKFSFENLFPKLYTNHDFAKSSTPQNFDLSSNRTDNPEIIFKLPIEYLEKKHTIPQSVITDLELLEGSQVALDTPPQNLDISNMNITPSMYYYLLKPGDKDEFAQKLLPKWTKYITSDLEFLKDTQYIIQSENLRSAAPAPAPEITIQNTNVANIWRETKECVSSHFLEKYNYMDWKPLECLNSSETFLNIVGLYNIISPVLSLLLPVILLIVPFFLLRIRGIPITFGLYIEILKDIAKHNMIGKTINVFSNGGSISVDKLLYVGVSIFFYVMQTYQNTICCIRFYNNTNKIRGYLRTMREFSERQIAQMKHFVSDACAGSCISYNDFCEETKKHIEVLTRFHAELSNLEKSSSIWMIGKMMRCFYLLHKDADYEKSLSYAIGFEGYILNLEGIRSNLNNNIIHFGNVSAEAAAAAEGAEKYHITRQYYPPLIACEDIVPIKNTVSLNKSIIITGPNASGKTTAIKTMLLNIIFTQQIGAGFYDKCNIVPYTHIHSYLNIPDTSNRDSLFQAEARRCKEIITSVSENGEGARHFAIFDELFSGTNAKESIKTGQSFLKYLGQRKHVNFVMTTHFTEICKKLKKNPSIKMIQMDTKPKENGEFEYTYKMKNGISNVLGAVKVLKDMDFPIEILNEYHK